MEMEEKNKAIRTPQDSSGRTQNGTDALDSRTGNELDDSQTGDENVDGEDQVDTGSGQAKEKKPTKAQAGEVGNQPGSSEENNAVDFENVANEGLEAGEVEALGGGSTPSPEPQAEAPVDEEKPTEDEQPEEDNPHDGKDPVDEEDKDENEEANALDYSNYSKKQLVQVLESLLKDDDFEQISKILREIRPVYDEMYNTEKEEAFQRYLEEGGEKDGFEYKGEELDLRFNKAYDKLKRSKNEHFNSLGSQREQNLEKKQEVLEKLRKIVDAEETTASINDLKKIQQEWKSIGPVAPQHLKSLWANYNALLDRYYDQRSIYFELKELDRKKNLELKLELCEKAEALETEENLKEAVTQLNELHEEFKYIGPIPREDQENVWVRFKAASDKIYSRRKDFYDNLREELKVNLVAKQALVEKVQAYADFDSDRISEWNHKTKELLAIQKEWEAIGGLPKEKAKKINKVFWSSFKSFFNRKGSFFKKLEESRKENLDKKQELVEKAESLKDNDDFESTSEQLKELQKAWKEIGPVPEKYKNELYKKFKEACDHFFNRRRTHKGKEEEEYGDNLKKKQGLSKELEQMVLDDDVDLERVHQIVEEYQGIGYVPRNAIKSIQKRFVKAVSDVVDIVDIAEADKHQLKFKAQFNKVKFGPNTDRFLEKREGALRRQISQLENEINLWRNNLDFFADSKKADKLKEEFNQKIEKAAKELKDLKDQLRLVSNI